MDRKYVLIVITFVAIACLAGLCGCAQTPLQANNETAMPSAAPANVSAPVPAPTPLTAPAIAGCHPAYGRIYHNGSTLPGAQVEGVSSDGTYRAANVSNSNGTYFLLMPAGSQFNITARLGGMKRTVWPAFPGYQYDVNLTATNKSYITGTGRATGGPIGFNSSLYNLSGTAIVADRGLGYAPLIAFAGNDGRYVLELEPDVMYHVHGATSPSTWLYYHNTNSGGLGIDIMLGPGETALIDYTVVLPSTENSLPIIR